MTRLLLILSLLLTVFVQAQEVSFFIVIDQFGYRPISEKIAVIRDPQIGFDASESFSPGTTYALCESGTNTRVFESNITSWNSGATDA